MASTKAVSTMTEPTNDQPLESVPAGRQPKSARANMQPATRTTLHNQQPAIAQTRATTRLAPDALGMKALITATSLAVTLGGWAVLAIERPTPPSAAGFEPSMAPLPTIVAPPPPPPKIEVDSPPARAGQPVPRRSTNQAVTRKPAAALPAPAAPALAAPPPLRVVSAPPKPVARTRSSR
jgi:hypothetical protein